MTDHLLVACTCMLGNLVALFLSTCCVVLTLKVDKV